MPGIILGMCTRHVKAKTIKRKRCIEDEKQNGIKRFEKAFIKISSISCYEWAHDLRI